MLELNIEELKMIPLVKNLPYYTLIYRTDKLSSPNMYMTSINQQEEELLESGETIHITRGNEVFDISTSDITIYGEIDFKPDSDDMVTIKKYNWFSHLVLCGFIMPAKYDYEHHCAYSDLDVYRTTESFRTEEILQYVHGMLGKPERIVIFKSSK